jgi:hypothetical protein
MPFNTSTLAEARKQGATDDDIYNHLIESDDRFRVAKEQGASLDDIAAHIETKGGEYNANENKQETNMEGNAPRVADQQKQYPAEAGPQPSQVRLPESKGEEQRVGNIDTSLSVSTPFITGGEIPSEKDTKTEGQRAKEGSQDGQGLRGEVNAGNKKKVTNAEAGGVRPPEGTRPTTPKKGSLLNYGEKAISEGLHLGDVASRGISKGVYEFGEAGTEFGATPAIQVAQNAEWLFGKNKYSDEIYNNREKVVGEFKSLAKSMDLSETEKKSTLDSLVFATAKMVPDLLAAALTEGVSAGGAVAKGGEMLAKTTEGIWKPIADKAIHGLKSFAPTSLKESSIAINDAKEKGMSDQEALAEGIKTLVQTEAGAVLPMSVSSGLKNVVFRGASRFLQAYPLALAQQELVGEISNLTAKEENRQPTLTENIITGNMDEAVKQAAGAVPMAALGIVGENTYKVAPEVAKANLPETAGAIQAKEPVKFEADPSTEIETLYRAAEESVQSGNREAASSALAAIKKAEEAPENVSSPEQQATRNQRWTILDSQVEGLKPRETTEAKAEAQPTKADATKTGEVKEDTTREYPQGDQGREAPKTGYSHSLQPTEEGQEKIEGKRIAAAAWKDPETGIVHEGSSHEEAMQNAGKEPITDPAKRETNQFGYTTENGEFISREDGEVLAKESGQFKGKQTDRPVMHSNEVNLDKTKEQHTKFTPEQYGPGAAAGAELYGKDLQFGAQIQQGKKGISFEKWRELFEPRMYEGKYDEQQLRDIYDKSKQVAGIAETGVPIPEAVKQLGKPTSVPKSKSSIANEDINRQRQSMGLSRLHDVAKQTWKSVWDTAMYKIDSEPQYQFGLIEKLKKNPNQPLSQEDQAILHHRIIGVRHEYDSAIDALNKATDPSDVPALKQKLQQKENEFLELTNISKLGGRATAQSLNMRKAMIADDYSLLGMIRKAKAEIAGRDEAAGGSELTPEERTKIEGQHEKINDLENQVKERVKKSKDEAQDKDLEDFTGEVKKSTQKEAKQKKKVSDMSADDKIQKYLAEIRSRKDEGQSLGTLVRSLAKAVYQKGFEGGNDLNRNQLGDAVHKLVSKEMGEGWSEGQTKDAITGYGIFKQLTKDAISKGFRAINGELREIGKQADIRQKEAPKKTGMERAEKGPKERIEIKKNNALIKKLGIVVKDPATQLAGAMDAIKNRLRNHIEELKQRIETGERVPKKTGLAYDKEATALKEERDQLQQVFDTLYGKEEKTMDEKVAALEIAKGRLIEAKKKQIADEKERLAAGKPFTEKQKEKITSDKIEVQNAELEQLNQELKSIRDSDAARKDTIKQRQLANQLEKQNEILANHIAGKVPEKKGPELTDYTEKTTSLLNQIKAIKDQIKSTESYQLQQQRALLQSYRARLQSQKVDYLRRIAEKDYEPKTKAQRVLDPETEKLKDEVRRTKNEFEEDRKLDRWKNRNKWEKAADLAVGWKRFAVLSYLGTLAKLGFASAEIALFKAPTALAGKVIGQLPGFKEIAKLAPSEGGGKISEDIANYTKGLWSGLKEAKDIAFKQDESRLTLLHKDIASESQSKIPKGALGIPGKIHEAIKNPTKRAVYEMSFARHLNWMSKNIPDFDIHDETYTTRASIEAFKDANRSIFMEDNYIVKQYNSFVSQLQRSKAPGGQGAVLKSIGYGLQELVPIVKIPTNIVKQVLEYQLGTGIAAIRVARAINKGLENVSPEDANSIMRQAKNGSIGLFMMAIGAALPQYVGGLYRKDAQPAEDEPGFNEIKIGDLKVSKQFMHHPALIALQLGATMRKVWDDGVEESETPIAKGGLVAKAAATSQLGLIRDIPLFSLGKELGEYLDPERTGTVGGNFVRSNIPGFVQETAKWIDRDSEGNQINRQPDGFLETIEQGLPWFRQSLQEK